MVMPCPARTPVSAAMLPAWGLVCPGWGGFAGVGGEDDGCSTGGRQVVGRARA
jgi:hypothetical protein